MKNFVAALSSVHIDMWKESATAATMVGDQKHFDGTKRKGLKGQNLRDLGFLRLGDQR